MKFSVFATLTLCLFSLAFCKNNASGDSSNAPGAPSSAPMAAEPNKLAEQMVTDILNAKAATRSLTPVYEGSMDAMKSMRGVLSSKGESELDKIRPMIQDVMTFRLAYEEQIQCSDKLDSLANRLMAGQITLEESQKEYQALREQLNAAAAKVKEGQATLQSAKAAFEREYPDAPKVSGGH